MTAFWVLGGLGGLTVGAAVLSRRRHAAPGGGRPALGEALKHLPPELAGRYLELVELDKRARQSLKARGLEGALAGELRTLDWLLGAYLRLAGEAAPLRSHLLASPPGAVEREAERIRERLVQAEGEPAILMQQNLAVVEKRLERLEQVRTAAARLKSQLDELESAVRRLHDEALAADHLEAIRVDLAGVRRDVEATEALLAETRAVVGDRPPVLP